MNREHVLGNFRVGHQLPSHKDGLAAQKVDIQIHGISSPPEEIGADTHFVEK